MNILHLCTEKTFLEAIDTVQASIYWKDLDGHYLVCNKYMLDTLGLSDRKDVIGKTDLDLFDLDEAKALQKNDQIAIANGSYAVEENLTLADGKTAAHWSIKSQLLDSGKKVIGIKGSSFNIVDHKTRMEAEKQRAISDEKSQVFQIIDSVEASIYWKDLNGVILGCNQYVLDMFGTNDRQAIIGKNEYELVPKEEAIKITEHDQSVLANGHYEGEEIFTLSSGRTIVHYVVKNRLLDSENNIIGLVGTSLDITAQKETEFLKQEKELQKTIVNEQEKFRKISEQIIDAVDASIYWKDREGRYLGCNRYVVDIFGFQKREEIIGKTDFDLLSLNDASRTFDVDQAVINEGDYRGEEYGEVQGEKRVYFTVKNQLYDTQGNVIGLIGTGLDITAKKEAEQLKLEMERERQKNEMLQLEKKSQQFLAEQQEKFKEVVEKAVHDINTPLTIIGNGISACNGVLPEERLTRVQQAYDNVLFILKDLAKNYKIRTDSLFSKNESRQDLLVIDFVADVLEEKKFQYLRHPVSFELSTTEAVKTAHIDAQSGRLRRALSNLLNNAIDALPKNNGVIKVALDANEDSVFITISDNGRGMAPEAVQRILERIPFTENKTNGHGVGLKQVWETLDYNRGTMKIESAVGKGTSFKLAFPQFEPTNWIAQEIVLYRDTILLILDDDKSFHVSWTLYLKSMVGYSKAAQTKYFSEGVEAINFIAALSEEERKRVLLLADYELANQTLTGLDVIISCNMTNAILVTGHANDAEIRHAALTQGITLLPKTLISDIPIKLVKDPLQVA